MSDKLNWTITEVTDRRWATASRRFRCFLLVAASLAVAFLAACQQNSVERVATPLSFILAFDTSGSFKNELGLACDAAGILSRKVKPKSDELKVFSFDTDVREVSSDPAIATNNFNHNLFEKLSVSQEEGTDFVTLLERLNRAANQTQNKQSIILVFTDGAPDGPRDQSEGISQKLKQLSKNPRVAYVYFLGVSPGFREHWRDKFETIGNNLYMGSFNEISAVDARLNQLRQTVQD